MVLQVIAELSVGGIARGWVPQVNGRPGRVALNSPTAAFRLSSAHWTSAVAATGAGGATGGPLASR